MLTVAIGLYIVNLGVGLVAQTGRFHFGSAHHALYFLVFVAAIAGTFWHFHPALLLTLAALALMPKMRPHTYRHPVVALIGFSGYLLALLL